MHIVKPDSDGLAKALAVLTRGGIVAHATETCYGFACDLSNSTAVKKLFAVKDRPLSQPVSALFASIDEAKQYVEWNDRAEELAAKHLPGPLTLILLLKPDSPHPLTPTLVNQLTDQPSIGVRISSHPLATALVASFGRPLSTTSANLHGQPNPYSVLEIEEQFRNEIHQPDLILDSGVLPRKPPSTVINLTEDGDKTLRTGEISGLY